MLDGDPEAEVLEAWVISRVCEEFKCLPSEAIREIENDPDLWVFEVMELRAFAGAFEFKDKPPDERPDNPVIDTVLEIEMELEMRRQGLIKDEAS